MKVDLEFLKMKKEILVQEAEKLFEIQTKSQDSDHSYLIRAITNEPNFIKGNLPFCFVQKCIKNTDDIFDLTFNGKEPHYRCDIKFTDDVIKMWQNMDRKYKKVRPERGDLVLGHYVKQNSMVTNGFIGIVKSVNQDLVVESFEASVKSIYEEEERQDQFDGLKIRTRAINTKGKCRILGSFTPWFF